MLKEPGYLNKKTEKWLKALHITFAAGCIGSLFSMIVLVILKNNINTNQNLFNLDFSIYHLVNTVLNYSFYGIIVTAVIYGLFTHWGFLKYYWIILKWSGAIAAFAIVWFWLGPAVNGCVAISDAGFGSSAAAAEYARYGENSRIFIYLQCFIFILLVFISVLKPWGLRKTGDNKRRKVSLIISICLFAFLLSGSIMQYISLKNFRNIPIADIDPQTIEDGTYSGQATFGGFTYKVNITVAEHTIRNINIIQNRKSDYARFAEGVIAKIIRTQKTNVEAITGATTTSKCLLKAIENALLQPAK
ncbi:FMN-binding protein [candidate division KSB1 bacterium]|nr:FMN-binding protein [candidate division KSB1 bacterium]